MQIYMPFSIKLRNFDTVKGALLITQADNIRLFWQRRGRLLDLCR